ncbi:uncharacterized protein FOMMEDRAFT_130894 [Fomitiporia mediterranea MF3/22]|uniref:uncharacterized protein n=1 Tax=Fomitiporia mediterranea (strain MF3/22) TaxID=694068 RepID=UPI0004409A1E|nr:uncharacterized protein FOMMEDRAFT_130894 [Fomitiporia mediterranea MF3/22]EJD07814.1 hypothetical protein FOMMEDRAFT_130894 [Fomitiporia mediterranea MF3/22]
MNILPEEEIRGINELESDSEDLGVSSLSLLFESRNTPNPLTTTELTTLELHELIHKGYIDLSPLYQRNLVWSREKQIILIESILSNYYIPPVLFCVQPNPDRSDIPLRVCMDRKNPTTKMLFYYKLPRTQTRKKQLLKESLKNEFDKKMIVCVEYRGIEPTKMVAISTPFADWIIELDNTHTDGDDNRLNVVLRWDTSQAKHFSYIVQLVYCCKKLPKQSDVTNQKITVWLYCDDTLKEELRQKIDWVLNKYQLITSSDNLNQAFTKVKQIVVPVNQHTDICTNKRVTIMLWGYIEKAAEQCSIVMDTLNSTAVTSGIGNKTKQK